jgi:hypothetical protein
MRRHSHPPLIDARANIEKIKFESRRLHCSRVLENFVRSEHAKRRLKPIVARKCTAMLYDLELRLSADLCALEGDEERIIYFNANAVPQHAEVAKKTLEIAHWLLEHTGVGLNPAQVEFIDLSNGALPKITKRRSKTIRDLEANAKLIGTLWPAIGP